MSSDGFLNTSEPTSKYLDFGELSFLWQYPLTITINSDISRAAVISDNILKNIITSKKIRNNVKWINIKAYGGIH